jgi:mannose-6-phosphate isomerase-like protein (cupin superfamily)
MRKILLTLVLSCAVAFPAADPAGFHIWKHDQIDDIGKKLSTKLDAHHVGSESLVSVGNRSFSVAHREGDGQAEWHEKVADVLMIESGAVTLVYGGEIVDAKKTEPGQIRGASIKGGTETMLGPGDVIHIPAKVPHQMKVAPGKTVTYFVVKVVQ